MPAHTIVYTDSTGATRTEVCHTASNYIIRVEELESAGYTVIPD